MKRCITALLTCAALTFSAAQVASAASFPDVGEKNWCYSYVTDLADKGIVTGLPDGNYGPEQPVTRGSVAKLLWESLKYKDVALSTDSQVTLVTGAWSAQYINELASAGILLASEYPNGAFVENAAMSRLETIKAIVRAYLVANPTAKLPTASLTFTDASSIPAADQPLVAMGVDLGIINGITVEGGTKFAPNDPIQRSTVAAMISRFLDIMEQKHGSENVTISTVPTGNASDLPALNMKGGKTATWVIAPTIDSMAKDRAIKVGISDEGLAWYYDNDDQHRTYVDMDGNTYSFPNVGESGDFVQGLAPAEDKATGLWGYINMDGEFVIEAKYRSTHKFQYDYLVDGLTGYWGWAILPDGTDVYLTLDNKQLSLDEYLEKMDVDEYYKHVPNYVPEPTVADSIFLADGPLPGGTFVYQEKKKLNGDLLRVTNLSGLMDSNGRVLVDNTYEKHVSYRDYVLFANRQGPTLDIMKYDIYSSTGKKMYTYYSGGSPAAREYTPFRNVRDYGNGLFSAMDANGKYGLMLPTGEFAIEPIFDDIEFSFTLEPTINGQQAADSGYVFVQYNGLWGIIKVS